MMPFWDIGHLNPVGLAVIVGVLAALLIGKRPRDGVPNAPKLCRGCGTSSPNFARFCRHCGRPV